VKASHASCQNPPGSADATEIAPTTSGVRAYVSPIFNQRGAITPRLLTTAPLPVQAARRMGPVRGSRRPDSNRRPLHHESWQAVGAQARGYRPRTVYRAAVRELQSGLWWWEAVHPEWTPEDAATADWGPEVSSYAIDDGERLLLFAPTAPPSPVGELAADRETVIVLTCPWHAREARSLAERLGATIYVPPPDEGDPNPVEGQVFRAGDRLPVGVEAFPGMEPNDLVFWIESHGALVAGDTLIDRGRGLEFPAVWASRGAIAARGVPPEQIRETLRPLLELPVELVLPTHGAPADRAGLERALS
jgi:glyoxylase-like metal-dependent hydrolase (beta-lactamase superfamily II)